MSDPMEQRHLQRAREFVAAAAMATRRIDFNMTDLLFGAFQAVEAEVTAAHVDALAKAIREREDLRRALDRENEHTADLANRLYAEQQELKRVIAQRDRAVQAVRRVQAILDDETMDLPAMIGAVACAVKPGE